MGFTETGPTQRTLQGVVPLQAPYLGLEPPGSAAEAGTVTGAVGRPRTVTDGAEPRSVWTDTTSMGAVRAPAVGAACEHHNIPRLRARFRLLVYGGPWSGQGAVQRLRHF